jgi:DNA-binding MarR family transcriptional regulator
MSTQVLSPQASAELSVWAQLLRGHSGLTRELSAKLLEEHGLTINDFEVLLVLYRAEDRQMRRVDLADAVVLSPSGITRLLEGLQKQGYVEKRSCDTDARVSYAGLTDAGEAKLRRASDSHQRAALAAARGRVAPLRGLTLRRPSAPPAHPYLRG